MGKERFEGLSWRAAPSLRRGGMRGAKAGGQAPRLMKAEGAMESWGPYSGMGLDAAALAACDDRDRLDRLVVLVHASRRVVAQNEGHAAGRLRRVLAGARRRLLRDEQIYARPRGDARPSDLAQVAVLLDLDLRLQPAVLGLLRPVERSS